MITPSFSLTATERVLPKLALDFTTASLDPRITFTRTTDATHPATYVNSSGYIASAANNAPRFDYDPVTLACKGLLIEESRSNNVIQSSDCSNAAWAYSDASPTGNSTLSPDGTVNATKVTELATTANHFFRPAQRTGLSVGVDYTFSIFARANERRYVSLSAYTAPGTYAAAVFDLTTKTQTATGALNFTLTNSGINVFSNGWCRCYITFRISGGTTCYAAAALSNVSTLTSGNYGINSYTGDGTSSIYAYGGQFETGAFPTSYIPTTSAALTRNADVATMTGTNFSDWYNASEGTFVTNHTTLGYSSTNMVYCVSDGTVQNVMQLFYSAANNLRCNVYTSNVLQAALDTSIASQPNSSKVSFAIKTDNFGRSVNAGSVSTDTSGTISTVNKIDIGNRLGLFVFCGTIKSLFYYPQRLINAELQAFSK